MRVCAHWKFNTVCHSQNEQNEKKCFFDSQQKCERIDDDGVSEDWMAILYTCTLLSFYFFVSMTKHTILSKTKEKIHKLLCNQNI